MAKRNYSKVNTEGWAKVYSMPDKQIQLTFKGSNSNGANSETKVTINTWQFADVVKKVGEVLKNRVEYAQQELSYLQKSVAE